MTQKAIKEVIAWQLAEAMKAEHITKTEMARRMNTSRFQLDRVLDPENVGVSLDTLNRAAALLAARFGLNWYEGCASGDHEKCRVPSPGLE